MRKRPLTLATFNIEWFGKQNYKKDYAALFKEIEKFDVTGIQEITDTELFNKEVKAHLGKKWKCIFTGYPGEQKIGFLFNTETVTLKNAGTIKELDVTGTLRPAFLGVFLFRKGKFQFACMVVHLKSGVKKTDRATRKAQWDVMKGAIGVLKHSMDNIVVMGDMNTRGLKRESLDEMNSFIGATDFIAATTGDTVPMTHKNGGRIDHILISPSMESHFRKVAVGGACKRCCSDADCSAYWDRVSDHCPVSALFAV